MQTSAKFLKKVAEYMTIIINCIKTNPDHIDRTVTKVLLCEVDKTLENTRAETNSLFLLTFNTFRVIELLWQFYQLYCTET